MRQNNFYLNQDERDDESKKQIELWTQIQILFYKKRHYDQTALADPSKKIRLKKNAYLKLPTNFKKKI